MTEKIVGRLIDTNLELAGGINNRLPAVFDTIDIYLKAVSYIANGNGLITINGTIYNVTRGFGLVRLDEFSNFIDFRVYDTWGSDIEVTALIDTINSTPKGHTMIFATYDEPFARTASLRSVLTSLGFMETSRPWTSLCKWYGVIQVGVGYPLIENYADKVTFGDFIEETIEIPKGIIHFPLDDEAKSIQGITPYKYCPKSIRYIRDWVNNSTMGASDIWTEIQALDIYGTNIALDKPVTTNSETPIGTGSNDITRVTNGSTDSALYYNALSSLPTYVNVDLGGLFEINQIKVWHYYIDGRTFYDTKTEVSVDGKTWYPVFDSAIEGTYVETIDGKTIDLFTNVLLDSEGMYVGETKKNQYVSSDIHLYNNYPAQIYSTLTTLEEKYKDQPVYRLAITITDISMLNGFKYEDNGGHGVYITPTFTFKASTKYARSIYFRPINKQDVIVNQQASNIGGWSSATTEIISEGWKRSVSTRDGTATGDLSDVTHFSVSCPTAELNETLFIDFSCHMLEEGYDYATEYIPPNTTVTDGKKFILDPKFIDIEQGTISCLFKPSKGFFSSDTTWNRLFGICTTNTNRNEIQVKRNGSSNRLVMSISNESLAPQTPGGWASCQSSPLEADKWYHVIARWSFPQGIMSLTVDSVIQSQVLEALYKPTVKGNFVVGYHPHVIQRTSRSRFKDLTIFNRMLTDEEAISLSEFTFKINQYGDLNVPAINQKPAYVPPDAYYFPLDDDTKTDNGLVSPVLENNVLHEDGSSFIETSTSSILQYNLNRDIELNWSEDWSLFYAKKPIGTSLNDLTGYCIEALGTGTNTVGGGYAYWGKHLQGNEFVVYIGGQVILVPITDIAKYFNSWQYISINKLGSNITFKFFLNDGELITITQVLNTTVSNYFVTQFNTDLRFDGWGSSYYKDLFVLKRAMTDEEIDNLFRAHMSFSKDNKILNVSGGITTNKNIE